MAIGKKKKDNKDIIFEEIPIKYATVHIEGDSDLILSAPNARYVRETIHNSIGNVKCKEVPNYWEDIITAIHWLYPLPVQDTYNELNEEIAEKIFAENKPCISNFGLRKSFSSAVSRNEVDTYGTKFETTVSVPPLSGFTPIEYVGHKVITALVPPPSNRSSRVAINENVFSGWSAAFKIQYTENVYSLDKIMNIINLAGFGIGIGSGRGSGYGRYHIVGVDLH